MSMVDADWSIDRSTGAIRYIGDNHVADGGTSPTYATVIEFHRWLQQFADDAVSSGDDELDITDPTPSDRSTDNIITLINGYNIDQTAAEHLFDGSISQNGGSDEWSGLVVVGNVPDGTVLLIVQDNTFYSDPVTPYWGATSSGASLNGDAGNNILLRTLIPTRTGGSDVDGKRIRVLARELGDTYAEFLLTGGLGNATAAIFTSQDLNNQTSESTISSWDQFANLNEGFTQIDVTGDGTTENYYSKWSFGGGTSPSNPTINDLYEYTKWLQRRGSTQTLYGLDGTLFRGITHQIPYDNEASGPFSEPEEVTWSSGSGQLLALDDQGSTGTIWIQLLTGATPSDNDTLTGSTSGATADVNGSVESRSVSPAFLGQSTGSAIIGAYGIGVEKNDLTASDQLFDLTNTLRVPPNNVTFTVSGLVSGEDRILVGPENGSGALQTAQLAVGTALTGTSETQLDVGSTIPSDTPSTGSVRIQTDTGVFRRVEYSSFSGTTFTFASSQDFSTDNASAGNDVFISYLDKVASASSESFTVVFDTSRTLFIRVRDGGASPIKTFETTGSLGSAGGSSTAIRTPDA